MAKSTINEAPARKEEAFRVGQLVKSAEVGDVILVTHVDGHRVKGTVVGVTTRDLGFTGSHWFADDLVPFRGSVTLTED